MSFYPHLIKVTETQRNDLLSIPFIQQGASGKLGLESYQAFLTQAYHHVKHTVPLLMSCGGRLPERLEWLRVGIGEYIEEEMGHQEWILDDLNACGADAEKISASSPNMATELMVSYAYDTIHRQNPIGFFGMVQVLEGTSIALATQAAEKIQASLNLPQTAVRYLLSHGDLDIGHVDFFKKLMNQITHEDDQAAIVHGAKMFYKLYGDVFRSLPITTITQSELPHALTK